MALLLCSAPDTVTVTQVSMPSTSVPDSMGQGSHVSARAGQRDSLCRGVRSSRQIQARERTTGENRVHVSTVTISDSTDIPALRGVQPAAQKWTCATCPRRQNRSS
ncbi:hypothetical protein Anapl_04466 [Anas platyrhynchos]|uniref:Uncharacterized protein n=1 Tax=Anas platyrhynchos TaxID=8839 RepID=R0LL73_ANAPL|nr:hypothetical protein Anapl_04466 [Anas platyrhynchos]